jgi:hypothetical protein
MQELKEEYSDKYRCRYNKNGWNGVLVRRRYAIFHNLIYGNQVVVVKEDDIERAPLWGGFVKWMGGERPADTRFMLTCACGKKSEDCPRTKKWNRINNGK